MKQLYQQCFGNFCRTHLKTRVGVLTTGQFRRQSNLLQYLTKTDTRYEIYRYCRYIRHVHVCVHVNKDITSDNNPWLSNFDFSVQRRFSRIQGHWIFHTIQVLWNSANTPCSLSYSKLHCNFFYICLHGCHTPLPSPRFRCHNCKSIFKAGSHECQKLRSLHLDRSTGEHTDHSPKATRHTSS